MTAFVSRDKLLTGLLVGVVLATGWFAYQPALSGAFLLDDVANLGDLAAIDDAGSALHFVLSGTAGPIGRPLALASFLPQADEWERGARAFLIINVVIHLVNALLVGAFLYLLSRARDVGVSESRYVALSAMALWLCMPLLASSTLMVVQRMTTMSAMFVLLGLNGYLIARGSIERNGNKALSGMSVALIIATAMAVLTKESGILLPVLILVVEMTLLSAPKCLSGVTWRVWSTLFLVVPAAVIVTYVATRLPYSESLVLRRDFSGWERLLTQARVLWEYLANGFIPRPGQYGPFHDAYPVSRTLLDPATLAAVAGWLVALVLALALRRKYPLPAFALLWFVGGHLLESTTIPLELYFEHRNYVPMVGPVYALCSFAVQLPGRYGKVARSALPVYILINLLFLISLTSLWGKPAAAAAYWHSQSPGSVRAATELANWQLATDGPGATLATLRRIAAERPKYAYVRVPVLTLSCITQPEQDWAGEAAELSGLLRNVEFSFTPATMLSQLLTTITRRPCQGVDSDTVRMLAQSLVQNPRYQRVDLYQVRHHQLMARIARHSGDIDGTLRHLHQAIEYQPDTDLNMMVVTTLVSDNQFKQARKFIEQSYDHLPLHPIRRLLWHVTLDELETYVDAVELSITNKSSLNEPGAIKNADR